MEFSARDVRRAIVDGVTTIDEIVPAPGEGRVIRVVGWMLTLASAGTIQWSSDADPLHGELTVLGSTPTGGFVSWGVYECADNEPLQLTASQAASGVVHYLVVTAPDPA